MRFLGLVALLSAAAAIVATETDDEVVEIVELVDGTTTTTTTRTSVRAGQKPTTTSTTTKVETIGNLPFVRSSTSTSNTLTQAVSSSATSTSASAAPTTISISTSTSTSTSDSPTITSTSTSASASISDTPIITSTPASTSASSAAPVTLSTTTSSSNPVPETILSTFTTSSISIIQSTSSPTTAATSTRSSTSGTKTAKTAATSHAAPTAAGWTPWIPAPGASFQIILSGVLDLDPKATSITPNTDIYDIDLFDTPASTIAHLHKLNKKVICYFSAGTYEDERPDSASFNPNDRGRRLILWPKERWVKLSSMGIRQVMEARIKLAKQKGCDAIDPDNIDGYEVRSNGLNLKRQDSIDYIKYLSNTAAKYHLSIGLKNGLDILTDVQPLVHFAVNEECSKRSECKTYSDFVQKHHKSVFNIEYPSGVARTGTPQLPEAKRKKSCVGYSGVKGMQTVLKRVQLDGWVQWCNGSVALTHTTPNGRREPSQGAVGAATEKQAGGVGLVERGAMPAVLQRKKRGMRMVALDEAV